MKHTIICCLAFTALSCGEARAQVSASNPSEWIALAEGNDLINKQISKQMGGQSATAALQNTIAAEFNQIHKWQDEYNSYLIGCPVRCSEKQRLISPVELLI